MTSIDKSPQIIRQMFDNIAYVYDFNNNLISLGLQKKIKEASVKELNLRDNLQILDLFTGTGDIIKILLNSNYKLKPTGVDFSANMLEIAKEKIPGIKFIHSDAGQLPFRDQMFDIVTMGFGLRNAYDYNKIISESYRVLTPGGELMHLDFSGGKRITSLIFELTAKIIIKNIIKNPAPYEYLLKSRRTFFAPEKLIEEFETAGFKLKKRKDFLFGIISLQIFEKPCN